MKVKISLKLAAVIAISLFAINFSMNAFGDEAAPPSEKEEQKKMDNAVTASGGCAKAQDLQKFVIYYNSADESEDEAVSDWMNVWQQSIKNKANQENDVVACVNSLNVGITTVDTNSGFKAKAAKRIQSIYESIGETIDQTKPGDLKISTPVATYGIRG